MLALSGCGVMRSGVGGNEGSHHAQRQVVRLQTSGKITKRADIAATVGGAAGTAQSLTRIRDVGRVIIGDLLSHTYIAESEQTIAGSGQPNSCTWLAGMVNQIINAAMRQQIAVVINLEAMNTQAEPLDQRLRLCNGAVILVTKLIDDDTRALGELARGENTDTAGSGITDIDVAALGQLLVYIVEIEHAPSPAACPYRGAP
jgi:hypothetical protein